MRVALSGGSGFVASHLLKHFRDSVILKRDDTHEQILKKLEGVDVVFNLAGAPIIKRWSEEYKKVLRSSRIDTTKKLVNAINESEVKHFISTSAVGAYPDGAAFDESFAGYGDDFLGSLAREWEDEAKKCNKPTAVVRFGVVLGSDGGALATMLPPFKLGLGGIIGDGGMMMSWIDVDDLVGLYAFLCEKRLSGTFNATAPHPVSNAVFTKTLGEVLHRPTFLPLPEFVLRLIYGEGSTVLTGSKEIYPRAVEAAGYLFKYPRLRESLEHLLA